jgi:hypothetical protein
MIRARITIYAQGEWNVHRVIPDTGNAKRRRRTEGENRRNRETAY